MTAFAATSNIRQSSLAAVVTRCGCGTPGQHAGTVCPRPRAVENKGVIAYWHKNPLRRLLWRLHIWRPQ
jgi:hypothetical protein